MEAIRQRRKLMHDTAGMAMSDRERECVALLSCGTGPLKIASILCLSVKTVNTYIGRAKDKLNANSTTHLAVLWSRQQWEKDNFISAFMRPLAPTPEAEANALPAAYQGGAFIRREEYDPF